MSARLGRYLVPLVQVHVTRESLARVARTARAAFRAGADAGAPPLAADIGVDGLSLRVFTRLYDPVRPLLLSLTGRRDPLLNPELPSMVAHATAGGSRVNVVTDGAHLDPGRAHALVTAGLATITVESGRAGERGLRNLERLVALRDANRRPGPDIALRLGDAALADRCRRRFPNADIQVRPHDSDAGGARCYVPWYACTVAADGEVYPCRHHAARGASVGNVLREPFSAAWEGPRMRAFRAGLRERRRDDTVCATCGHDDTPLARVFGAMAKVPGLGRG